MALGIACAGSGFKEALSILEPMINDPVNYVRQGALIASAMILVQHNENTCSKVKTFRELYSKTIADKHEDVMAKFGAILAQGILDAGGRNVSISLQSRTGHTHMSSVVGLLVFIHFWYWFPLAHFLSLSFTPTTVVGLNADLKMPVVEIKSNAKPSQFAYPPPLEAPKEKEKEKVATAVLSITAKAKKREKKEAEDKMDVDEGTKKEDTKEETKEKDETTEKMDVDEKPADDKAAKEKKDDKEKKEEGKKEKEGEKDKGGEKKDGEKKDEDEKKEKKKEEPEPNFEMLSNPARVMKAQLRVLAMPDDGRYKTIKEVNIGGIMMLKDTNSEEPEKIVQNVPAGGPKMEEEEEEPEPPEPFEYTED